MKLRIFALAFSVGFIFCFMTAAFFIFRFSGRDAVLEEPQEPSENIFLETEYANFLLIYDDDGRRGPFTLINFDARTGKIPVFSFSEDAALEYGGVFVSAGDLYGAVSPGVFAGAVETNLGIEISGYFIWNRAAAEALVSKTGPFDYVLPKDIRYSGKTNYVSLVSGIQNMTGKKICDVICCPGFSEGERCDILSRMGAAFFNRRLKHFLPGSSVYSTVFNYTKTDVSAFDKEKYSSLAKILCDSGESLSGHITNDTEKDLETGLLYFSDETKKRVKKYFG